MSVPKVQVRPKLHGVPLEEIPGFQAPISAEDLARLDAQAALIGEVEALGDDLARGAGETFELNSVGIETVIAACAFAVGFSEQLPAIRAKIAEFESEGPGTPLGRLNAICEFAERECGHNQASAKGGEGVLLEAFMQQKATIAQQAQRIAELERGLTKALLNFERDVDTQEIKLVLEDEEDLLALRKILEKP